MGPDYPQSVSVRETYYGVLTGPLTGRDFLDSFRFFCVPHSSPI